MYSLNSKYFNPIKSITDGNYEHVVYHCVYDTMILYSKSGTALAAVSMKCADDSDAKMVIAPRMDKTHADFQCMITEDNQEFQFVITNLCENGMVKIDIMKSNVAVEDVDPGAAKGGINQVNELHAFQSYVIAADQENKKSMVLSTIKNQFTGGKISVGDSEMMTPHKPSGTYYYIAVTPQVDIPELVEKFAETNWVKDDLVHIKITSQFRNLYTQTLYRGRGRIEYDGPTHLAHNGPGRIEYDGPTQSDLYDEEAEADDNACDLFDDMYVLETSKSISAKVDDIIIKESCAATVVPGREIEVHSNYTGVNYAYDVSSNKTGHLNCISISVHTNIQFIDSEDDRMKRGEELIKSFINKQHEEYFGNLRKIYTLEECVICMEKGIDTVFYDCGHSCCHKQCSINDTNPIVSCPLCRRHIAAILTQK